MVGSSAIGVALSFFSHPFLAFRGERNLVVVGAGNGRKTLRGFFLENVPESLTGKKNLLRHLHRAFFFFSLWYV